MTQDVRTCREDERLRSEYRVRHDVSQRENSQGSIHNSYFEEKKAETLVSGMSRPVHRQRTRPGHDSGEPGPEAAAATEEDHHHVDRWDTPQDLSSLMSSTISNALSMGIEIRQSHLKPC